MALIHELIPKIRAEIVPVGKDHKNTQQGFMFQSIDDVQVALQPALDKYGVTINPKLSTLERETMESRNGGILKTSLVRVIYEVMAPDGSMVHGEAAGEGCDSGDKATSKAHTMSFKTYVKQLFNIRIADMPDPDGETVQEVPQAVPKPVPSAAANQKPTASGPAATTSQATPCPECLNKGTLKPSKMDWGGGWYCDKKSGGCGAAWKVRATSKYDPDQEEIATARRLGVLINPDVKDTEWTWLTRELMKAGWSEEQVAGERALLGENGLLQREIKYALEDTLASLHATGATL